jgi:hypothetical protein
MTIKDRSFSLGQYQEALTAEEADQALKASRQFKNRGATSSTSMTKF